MGVQTTSKSEIVLNEMVPISDLPSHHNEYRLRNTIGLIVTVSSLVIFLSIYGWAIYDVFVEGPEIVTNAYPECLGLLTSLTCTSNDTCQMYFNINCGSGTPGYNSILFIVNATIASEYTVGQYYPIYHGDESFSLVPIYYNTVQTTWKEVLSSIIMIFGVFVILILIFLVFTYCFLIFDKDCK